MELKVEEISKLLQEQINDFEKKVDVKISFIHGVWFMLLIVAGVIAWAVM